MRVLEGLQRGKPTVDMPQLEKHASGIIAKVNAAVVASLADPKTREKLAGLGQEAAPVDQQNPRALGVFQKAEIEKWWPIVKAAGIKGD